MAWGGVGDPTEGALISLGLKAGINRDDLLTELDFDKELPFDSTRKMMTTVYSRPNGSTHNIYCKGAVESLLPLCTHIRKNGQA